MGNVLVGATMSLGWFMNDRHSDVSRLYPNFEALRRKRNYDQRSTCHSL